ncbi:hypothetical protein D3C83_239610 [compost metagenome]
MFLSTPISPEAEKLISKKMTVTRRKSMYEVRFRLSLTLRFPCPVTFRHTKWRGTPCISRRPGWWITWA